MVTARPAAIQADYCNFRRIRGRRVLVLEVEIPLEREREVFDVLGFPDPTVGCPIAIALLDPARLNENAPGAKPEASSGGSDQGLASSTERDVTTSDRQRKRWSELSRAQQAGIRCAEERFQRWLYQRDVPGEDDEYTESGAAEAVRYHCGVTSRANLDDDPDAEARWDALDAEYRRWAGLEAEPR